MGAVIVAFVAFVVGVLGGGYGGYKYGASVEKKAAAALSGAAKKV